MAAIYDELVAIRPPLAEDAPFHDLIDALSDAILAVAKVVDIVELEPVAFHEEFASRDSDEQTDLGIKVTLAVMTLQQATQSIAGGVADAFNANDAVTETEDEDV